jgi:DnaJ-class molecular chaperone
MPLTQDAAAIAAHYAILRIGRSATSHDAMKVYKKAIRGTHPDKGGDEEKAKAVSLILVRL